MKKMIIIIGLLCLMFGGCASKTMKVYVLGVDMNEAVKAKDVGMMLLGAGASIATHVAGHYVAAEIVGADIDQQGFNEVVMNPDSLSNSDEQWIARGGFVAQTLVNTVLTSFESTRELKFTRGYTLGTMLQVVAYPLGPSNRSGDGDLNYLSENGGNEYLEWGLYTGVSIYNFYRINKTESNSVDSFVLLN